MNESKSAGYLIVGPFFAGWEYSIWKSIHSERLNFTSLSFSRLFFCLQYKQNVLGGSSSSNINNNRIYINEFHYDNLGNDINEFIEVAAPEGMDISDYIVVLYNGFWGYQYNGTFRSKPIQSLAEDFVIGDTINGITFYTTTFKSNASFNAIENGYVNM